MLKKKTPSRNPRKTGLKKSGLKRQIETAVANLYYTSETDAEVLPFVGKAAETVTIDEIRNQTQASPEELIEEKDFTEFFARLTTKQDWFGDEEKATAKKYTDLKNLIETNLRDLNVFKIGKIQIDIYVVGLDADNILMGIRTKAVET